MNIFNDHKKLYPIAGLFFLLLTYLTAIMPALENQKENAPLPGTEALSGDALKGKHIYISEGCVACHSQQVRNVHMDKMFGKRPGIPADYAHIKRTDIWRNTATLMGTERTGPDLTDVGNRQSSKEWNLMHLFNPRSVVPKSIMPSYEWLFEIKEKADTNEIVLFIPEEFLYGKTGVVVPKKEAMQLVAYIQSLKQSPLPNEVEPMKFLYGNNENTSSQTSSNAEVSTHQTEIDGKALYTQNCQVCHQENGEGLKGAFPPLKGSTIVNSEDLELYVNIIMNGYDASPSFGVMSAIGTNMNFNEHQIVAIINHERSSWGNNGKKVTPEEIKKILDFLKTKTPIAP